MAQPKPKVGVASDGELLHYSVGSFVRDELGRYLLFERKFEPFGWASVAGHMDEGEDDPRAAMLREGREEIGTELLHLDFLTEEEVLGNHCYRASNHYWHLFEARVRAHDVRVDDHEAGKRGWFTRDEVAALELEPVWRHWFTKFGIIGARA